MGLLDWLFRRPRDLLQPKENRPTTRGADSTTERARFRHLRSRRFFGQFIDSENELYHLGWRDAPDEGGSGGFRESGPGRYLLIEGADENVIAEGTVSRPQEGKVANNGVFILNDWGFGSDLASTFWAFRPNGEKIISHQFRAGLLNNGLSSDGRLAACHTCNSEVETDSAVLTLFDLTRGVEIGRWHAESGWPSYYEFPTDGKTIGLGYLEHGVFQYSLTGEFIDRQRWQERQLTQGRSWEAILMAERMIKAEVGGRPTQELANRLLPHIDRVLRKSDDKRWDALGWKLKGVCLDANNAFGEAIDAYDKALQLNAKIGVKRRADQLRKLQSKSSITGRIDTV